MGTLEHALLTLRSPQGWQEWDRFLHSAAGATVYHREGWLRGVAEGMGQDVCVHMLTEDGAIRAGAVVRRGGRWGLRSGHKPWATAYNGLATAPEASPHHVTALYVALQKRYASIRLVHAPGCAVPKATAPEWTLGGWRTLLLDVRDLDRLWNACDRRVRQRVRKARGLGITVSRSENTPHFEDLYLQTYERQGLALKLPPGGVAHTVAAACAHGLARLYIASTSGGEPAAGLVVGQEGRRSSFMLAASHPRLRHTDAVTLLWWSALEEYAARVETVDLIGAGTSDIERFKRSFSPVEVDCVDAVAQTLCWRLARRVAEAVHV